MGSGKVADFHDNVLRYAHVKFASQFKPTSSIDSSTDGSGVSRPIHSAATWSTVGPTNARSPLTGCAPDRNTAAARTWFSAPPVSSPVHGATGAWASPLTTQTRSRNGASGARISENSNFDPTCAGVHLSIVAPCGM